MDSEDEVDDERDLGSLKRPLPCPYGVCYFNVAIDLMVEAMKKMIGLGCLRNYERPDLIIPSNESI